MLSNSPVDKMNFIRTCVTLYIHLRVSVLQRINSTRIYCISLHKAVHYWNANKVAGYLRQWTPFFTSAFSNHDLNFERTIINQHSFVTICVTDICNCPWPKIISAFCNLGHTNLPLDGFNCDGQSYKLSHGVTQAFCVHSCITSSSCTTMSYTPWPVSACWLSSLVWRPRNMPTSCWWCSVS